MRADEEGTRTQAEAGTTPTGIDHQESTEHHRDCRESPVESRSSDRRSEEAVAPPNRSSPMIRHHHKTGDEDREKKEEQEAPAEEERCFQA